jgi:hypothetical protein
MRHELLIYSGLLAAGLGASYWASLPETKEDASTQSLFNVAAANISEIAYEFDGSSVRLEKMPDSSRFWITTTKPAKPVTKHPKPETKPEETPDDPAHKVEAEVSPAEAALPPVLENFVAGDSVDKLFEAFAPFEALRSLGKISPDRLAEFGLKEGTGHFSLQSKESDKKFQFAIGGKSYGSRNVFIMNTETSEVFLANQDPFDQLRNASSRLYERRITTVVPDDIESATISALTKTKVVTHKKRDEAGQLLWSDEGAEGQSKASYKNWMEKFDKLRVLSYATKEQLAALELVKPFVEIQYQSGAKKLDAIAVKKLAEKVPGKGEEVNSYWIRSEFLSSWAKVNPGRLDSIEKDLPSLME